MWARIRQYWHFVVIGVLVLVIAGMSAFSDSSGKGATPPAPTPEQQKIADLERKLADLQKQPPAPAAVPPAAQPAAPAATSDPRSPFVESAPPGHHFVAATKGRNVGKDGTSCESRGGKIVPDMSKPLEKTGKGFRRPNKCTADA